MAYRALTANLGCGGPHPATRRRWAESRLAECSDDGIDLMFLQEVPIEAARTALEPGYQLFTPAIEDGDYLCRSVVAVRHRTNIPCRSFRLQTSGYHGSYVATALVDLPGLGEVVALSVHASPTMPMSSTIEKWCLDQPARRQWGTGELWDSDFVLATVVNVAAGRPVLAAGDWNEARRWDETHEGSNWGDEYFGAVAKAGLRDCTFSRWNEERATHRDYQDDHVIASGVVDDRITEVEVGAPASDGGSDHVPIWFTIS